MGQAEQKVQVWLIWLVAVLMTMATPEPFGMDPNGTMETSRAVRASTAVAVAMEPSNELFPWLPNYRWRKLALNAYRQGRRLYRQARYRYWVARRLAQMAQRGVLSLAWLMDRLTKRQMRYYLGALPLLYRVLDELKVAETINRYCPTQSKLSHGTVVLVLALNRLHAPRALWRVADWFGADGPGPGVGGGGGQVQKRPVGPHLGCHRPAYAGDMASGGQPGH